MDRHTDYIPTGELNQVVAALDFWVQRTAVRLAMTTGDSREEHDILSDCLRDAARAQHRFREMLLGRETDQRGDHYAGMEVPV